MANINVEQNAHPCSAPLFHSLCSVCVAHSLGASECSVRARKSEQPTNPPYRMQDVSFSLV